MIWLLKYVFKISALYFISLMFQKWLQIFILEFIILICFVYWIHICYIESIFNRSKFINIYKKNECASNFTKEYVYHIVLRLIRWKYIIVTLTLSVSAASGFSFGGGASSAELFVGLLCFWTFVFGVFNNVDCVCSFKMKECVIR